MRRLVAGTIAAVALAAAAATPAMARIPAPSLFGLNTGTFDPNSPGMFTMKLVPDS